MPTESELQEGAGFISYEYLMLAEAARLWVNQGLSEYSSAVKLKRRMATDVFLLHARNLINFLSPTESAKMNDDVVATDYNASWTCSKDSRFAGKSISEWRQQINKLLSHVTYERTTLIREGGPERWPIETIHQAIEARFGAFLATLSESRREWFGRRSETPRD